MKKITKILISVLLLVSISGCTNSAVSTDGIKTEDSGNNHSNTGISNEVSAAISEVSTEHTDQPEINK